jgi:shikimate kinase
MGKVYRIFLMMKATLRLREIENIALKSIQFNETILSTGGSAVYSDEAMEHIQQNSKVIFLEVPFSQILERVPSFLDRGFAKATNQSVKDAFVERQELYKKYSDSVVSNTKDLNSCVSKILELL